jgi:alginate O-acetyltransferase complex protein AlgI
VLFNSSVFLLLYLPLVLLGFLILASLKRHRLAGLWVTGASLFFYGWWNPLYVPVLMASIAFNYLLGGYLVRRPNTALLAFGITANVLLLGYFKYTGFLVQVVGEVAGLDWTIPNIVLPLAISFFTFQQIAYLVDAHDGDVVEHDFLNYLLFITFFPHLIAGPITHHREMIPQFNDPDTFRPKLENLAVGLTLFLIGLIKKVAIADTMGTYARPVYEAAGQGVPLTFLESWGGALSYALQVYFDFSGYTDIARGLGLWFGFRWPENFDRPYLAASVRDFWRRWHMTLSRFLRDYLYIPLGGGRHGRGRTAANLMLTMLLGGLWHGASWSFMLWGGLHGCYLIINHLWGETRLAARLALMRGLLALAWRWLCIALTFHAVCFAWCFFRLTRLADSLACIRKWVDFDLDKAFVGGSADVALWSLVAAYGLASLAAHLLTRGAPLPQVAERLTARPFARGLIWGGSFGVFALALLLSPGGETPPFIYFRF